MYAGEQPLNRTNRVLGLSLSDRPDMSDMSERNAYVSMKAGMEAPVYWRVEGSLLHLSAFRPIAFFTSNAQSFADRWSRRTGLALMAFFRPFLYVASRKFATRILHASLRGVSQDRLDLLGEEYFQYVLKPR